MLRLINIYQRWLSPLLPPHCRFYPSCSEYAAEAIQLHGGLRGSWLAIKRIGRCHPLCAGGHDPVPTSLAPYSRNSV
jgi:putative membrane protein insertion efficiency factor